MTPARVNGIESLANSDTATSPAVKEEGKIDKEQPRTFYIEAWRIGLNEAAAKIGRTFEIGTKLKNYFEATGFEDVVQKIDKVPTSPWAQGRFKQIGLYQQSQLLDATEVYGGAHYTRVLGWSPGEYSILAAHCRKELLDPTLQMYLDL